MMKLTLNTEIAMKLDGKQIVIGDVEYNISASTFTMNGVPMLQELTVDAFENDEWSHDKSCVYEAGDVINSKYDEWVMGLI